MSIIEFISKFYPLVFTILQLMILIGIKMNDLKHISDEMRDIKKVVDEINKKIVEHESRISKIEGKLNGYSD